MRHSNTKPVVLVSERELSSKECCTKYNRRVAPKTKCSAWTGIGQDTCGGPDAKCVPLCTRYISVDALSCGYDTSGCSMGCIDSRQVCRYDMRYRVQKTQPGSGFISWLPDGSLCVLGPSGYGTCLNNTCYAGPVSTDIDLTCRLLKKARCRASSKCTWCPQSTIRAPERGTRGPGYCSNKMYGCDKS